MSPLAGKHAYLVVAHRGFRDEELSEPRAALEAAGARVTVASSALGTAHGMLGATVTPDLLYSAISLASADALVFVGGEGATEFWDDRTAHRLAKEAVAQRKVLGAICYASSVLANAGVLEGRRATAFPTRAAHLRAKGCSFVAEPVVRDGRIVTGDGPGSVRAFGQLLVETLAGEKA